MPGGRLLGRLSRRTDGKSFVPVVDGLRFLAIGMVVLDHIGNNARFPIPDHSRLLQVYQEGHFGVEIFFVISGFILAVPFAAHRLAGGRVVDLRRYFFRRLTRLEPPYVVSLTVIFLGTVIAGTRFTGLAPHYLAGLLYMHSFAYGTFNPVNNVAWSLEIEVQFYMLVPIITRVFAIRNVAWRRGTIAGAALAAVALQRFVLAPHAPRLDLTILGFVQYFLAGFLAADVYLVDWRRQPRLSRLWDGVWLVALAVIAEELRSGTGGIWLLPAATFVLFLATFRGSLANRVFGNPWIYTIGGMCYSIYLLHYPLIQLVAHFSRILMPTGPYDVVLLAQTAILVPVVLLVSSVFFVLVERPCMNPAWPRALVKRFPRAGSGPSAPPQSPPQPEQSSEAITGA